MNRALPKRGRSLRLPLILCGPACLLMASPPGLARSDQLPVQPAERLITPETRTAVDRGLRSLASMQRDDGSFAVEGHGRGAAVVALSAMAFIASGSPPGRGPYGRQVDRAVGYVLDHVDARGLIAVEGVDQDRPMYGHGFATMMLAESFGMAMRPDHREKLSKAVELIVNTQNEEGGWRYLPRRYDADISVTVCEVMALRAARNAGFFIPRETIDKSIRYVKQCQNPDGGFRYMLPGGQSAFPRSAAAIVALNSAGIYEGEEITKGLQYLIHYLPRPTEESRGNHFFYGHYYAVQAMWHAGRPYWDEWYPAARDTLIARQRDDGSWMDPIAPSYGTAMALLILQLPNGYLPIFQR